MKINAITYKVLFLLASTLVVILAAKLFFTQKAPVNLAVKNSPAIIDEALITAKKLAEKVDAKGLKATVFERKAEIIGNGDIRRLPISKQAFDSLMLDNLDKTARLQQVTVIKGKLEANYLRASETIDSLQQKVYLYADSSLSVQFMVDSLGGIIKKVAWNLNLIKQDYKSRTWFLSPYTHYTQILSPDSRLTINGLKSLTISSQKPTRWGIGLQGGYYYDPVAKTFKPAIGLGISYNIIRF